MLKSFVCSEVRGTFRDGIIGLRLLDLAGSPKRLETGAGPRRGIDRVCELDSKEEGTDFEDCEVEMEEIG